MIYKTNFSNLNDNILFIFYNGFGSDYSYWDNLATFFKDHNCLFLSENYFKTGNSISEKELQEICSNKKIIGIGHSLGYIKLCLLCAKYDFIKYDKIIAIEGFSCYLGHNKYIRFFRKNILKYMKLCYAINPIATLINFQIFCGAIPEYPSDIDKPLLLKDLELLDMDIPKPEVPHLVLTSADDPVIPFYIIEDNFAAEAKIITTNYAGHLLGMKYPDYVHKIILENI